MNHKPVDQTTALIILDGFGHNDDDKYNAIAFAKTPNIDGLMANYPHTLISASGQAVGLPNNQMGNSEVGHINIGAGRRVDQNLARVNLAIETHEFKKNADFNSIIKHCNDHGKAMHFIGLLSDGGVHSHIDQIFAFITYAAEQKVKKIYVHAFLDGRDTAPKSAEIYLLQMEELFKKIGVGSIASIVGRYYAMDRDNHWDRIELAFNLLTKGHADYESKTAIAALNAAYDRGENDEFVRPTVIKDEEKPAYCIQDDDCIIFMNYRADRARQLTNVFVDPSSECNILHRPKYHKFLTLTSYGSKLDVISLFDQQIIKNTLGEYISDKNMAQLRIAETEKYAHVTFFLNAGREEPFPLEDRILIQSPDVATYDLMPEMSAPELTEKLVDAIDSKKYHLIICNYANCDMIGHTGNFDAAVKAVEVVDKCLGKVLFALNVNNGQCLITADHGNVEQMTNVETGQNHTAHTNFPVPLIYYGPQSLQLMGGGCLSDLAPSILALMHMSCPDEMTGKNLVDYDK